MCSKCKVIQPISYSSHIDERVDAVEYNICERVLLVSILDTDKMLIRAYDEIVNVF